MTDMKRIHIIVAYNPELTNTQAVLKRIRDGLADANAAIVGSVEFK